MSLVGLFTFAYWVGRFHITIKAKDNPKERIKIMAFIKTHDNTHIYFKD